MDIAEQLLSFVQQYKIYIDKIYRSEGITPQQALVLFTIPFDGISVHELASELGLHISTMTRNIKKLESLGMVKRTKNATDKRSVIIYISGQGVHIKSGIEASHKSNVKTIVSASNLINPLEFANNIETLTWVIKKMNIIDE